MDGTKKKNESTHNAYTMTGTKNSTKISAQEVNGLMQRALMR
jgi:hypothetical protein